MAWTAPMTFVSGAALTASQLNTHLRDNMFETEAAKVTAAGQYLVTIGRNHIEKRTPLAARVNTDETTTSTNFIDLDTIGPSVTVTSGSICLVLNKADIYNSAANQAGGMAFDIQGTQADGSDGTQLEARDSWMCMTDGVSLGSGNSAMNCVLISSIVPGTNTFTSKYKVGNSANTGHFRYRVIAVFPF